MQYIRKYSFSDGFFTRVCGQIGDAEASMWESMCVGGLTSDFPFQ